MKRAWLNAAGWTVVTEINRQLCLQAGAQHGPTSEGHEPAKRLWTKRHLQALDLAELAKLCHDCHRLAPFLNYNGNTFVAIARQAVATLGLPAAEAAVLRSLIGHVVAGTAEPPEHDRFLQFIRQLAERRA
jgi:hypothetical protein